MLVDIGLQLLGRLVTEAFPMGYGQVVKGLYAEAPCAFRLDFENLVPVGVHADSIMDDRDHWLVLPIVDARNYIKVCKGKQEVK